MGDFISGLDLGQAADYAALVTVERGRIPDPYTPGQTVNRLDVRRTDILPPFPRS